jgi:hypothetical protein
MYSAFFSQYSNSCKESRHEVLKWKSVPFKLLLITVWKARQLWHCTDIYKHEMAMIYTMYLHAPG